MQGGASADGGAIGKHLAERRLGRMSEGACISGREVPSEGMASAKALHEDMLRPDTQTGPRTVTSSVQLVDRGRLAEREDRGRNQALQQRSQCPDSSRHSGPTVVGEGP